MAHKIVVRRGSFRKCGPGSFRWPRGAPDMGKSWTHERVASILSSSRLAAALESSAMKAQISARSASAVSVKRIWSGRPIAFSLAL